MELKVDSRWTPGGGGLEVEVDEEDTKGNPGGILLSLHPLLTTTEILGDCAVTKPNGKTEPQTQNVIDANVIPHRNIIGTIEGD